MHVFDTWFFEILKLTGKKWHNLLRMREDQSAPVNQRMECWELCFEVALTLNAACGGAHSRARRWTQTPRALPLKRACVISTRSNRGYLQKPSDPFSCKAVARLRRREKPVTDKQSRYSYTLLSQKILPAICFSLSLSHYQDSIPNYSLRCIRKKQNWPPRSEHLVNHLLCFPLLIGALWNLWGYTLMAIFLVLNRSHG